MFGDGHGRRDDEVEVEFVVGAARTRGRIERRNVVMEVEVNMFKDDNTVVHFKKPIIQFSVRENLMVVTGNPETKTLQEMLPEALKQFGPH